MSPPDLPTDQIVHATAIEALERANDAAMVADSRLRDAIEAMPHGVVFLDAEGRYILWNRRYAEIYHASADLFSPGVRLIDTLRLGVERGDYPEAIGREQEWLAERDARLSRGEGRHEQWLADGRCIMIEERPTQSGGTIGVRVDITEMKQREESLRLLFESNPVPLMVYDPSDETIISANLAAANHFSHTIDSMIGLSAESLFIPAEWIEARRMLVSSTSATDRFWQQRSHDGRELESVLFTRATVVRGRNATIVSVFDVTERRRAEARVAHMARHDELTGLANRAHCRERLHEMLQTTASTDDRAPGETTSGNQVAIAMIDLDSFKPVNDSHGHHVGDMVLAEAARRMCALVPHDNALVCRIGGDEFAVIVQSHNAEMIHDIASSIVAALAEPFVLPDHTLHLGASAGIALAPGDTSDPHSLMRYADLALYAAKAHRRGTVRRFVAELDEAAQQKSRLESELRDALRLDQLVVHYQPLIDLGTGLVEGYEALVRWQHPARGLIYPDSFIPLAEELGLIDAVGQYVLHAACREAMHWPGSVRLAVNVSPLQFRNGHLLATIMQALAMSGLEPARLELEITEAVLIDKSPHVAEVIASIRKLGVGISMDDFGTGYSSLSYLLSYPFTKIKIDRSFIGGLKCNPNSRAVVNAIVSLGHSLGLTVTAEGIEESDDLDYLREIGCRQGQGYLIGKAIPGDQLEHHDPKRDAA